MRNFLYKRKIIYIIIIVVGIIALTGTTYAIFTTTTTQEGTNTINTLKCLELTFSNQSDAINLENTYPMSDERGKKNTPYTFTLTNKCGAYVEYSLGLAINTSNTLENKYIKTMFSLKNEDGETVLLTDRLEGKDYEGKKTYILKNDGLENNASKDYKLTLWIDESLTNSQMNLDFKGNIILQLKATKSPITVECDKGDNSVIINKVSSQSEAVFTKNCKVVGTAKYVSSDEVLVYKVKLENRSNTYDGLGLSYSLSSTNTSNNGKIMPSVSKEYIGTDDVVLGSGIIEGGTTVEHDYNLKIFLNNIGVLSSDVLSSAFKGQIKIEYSTASKEPTGWSEAKSGTLLAGIKTNNNTYTQLITSPGKETSSSSEAILAAAPDDYGMSYYYRGAVTNNYVEFANKCWRIVRVTGDGSIKLVLHNDNVNNVSSPCAASNNSNTAAFARYSGTTYTTAFNTAADDNTYVGFMYGAAGSSTYAATHANTNKSTILQNLETWYNNNLTAYENKLADTIWCNDKSTQKSQSLITTSLNTTTNKITKSMSAYPGLGYGTDKTLYSGRQRSRTNYYFTNSANQQYGTAGTGPDLICPNDDLDGNLSKFTAYDTINGNGALDKKIGLLTTDEVLLAGSVDWHIYVALNYKMANITSYIIENTKNIKYWTLSAYNFADEANIIYVGSAYALGNGVATTNQGLRPAISLKSDTTISKGTGTSSDPFVIS